MPGLAADVIRGLGAAGRGAAGIKVSVLMRRPWRRRVTLDDLSPLVLNFPQEKPGLRRFFRSPAFKFGCCRRTRKRRARAHDSTLDLDSRRERFSLPAHMDEARAPNKRLTRREANGKSIIIVRRARRRDATGGPKKSTRRRDATRKPGSSYVRGWREAHVSTSSRVPVCVCVVTSEGVSS